MLSPAASAASLTAEIETSCPLPRGRSGCVTTPSIRISGCAISCCREGTANAGVPQKTMRSAILGLPLAVFFELANLALDHVTLEQAEMVDLVAERPCQEPLAAHFEFFSTHVLRANCDVLRPGHVAAKSG